MEPRKNYNQDEIYELTKACKGKFLHLLESGAPQEQHSCHEFIRKQYDSFRVWIATTGALAPSEASLDHRLRDHGHILLAIVELLFLIQDCLKDEPCTIESDDQVDENSQIKTKDREVQNIVSQHGALNRALECLHQLASSIRRASIPNSQFDLSARLFKGAKLYDPNYLDYMKRLLKYRFPSAAESLIDQLATSMSRRQNLLLYKARHAQKLSQNRDHIIPSAFTGSNSPQNIETASAKHATGVERSIQTETQLPLRKAGLSFAYSNTEASRLLLNKATPRWRASSSITSTRAGVGLRNDQGVYPSIPTFSKDDEFCICPYCFQTLATKKLSPQWSGGKMGAGSSPQYWRNHYDDDIKPFVCISEACNDPLQFFSKFDSWEKHMVSQHSEDWPRTVHSIAWCCDIDDCRLDEKVFYQLKDFEEHLEGKPKRHFSANQITALAVRKQRTIRREVGTCPLCEVVISGLVSNLQNSPLADHIGGHLHYLASLCTIELNIVPDNTDSESQSKRRRTKEGSQTDSRGQLLTDVEREELIFYDDNAITDISSNAANTHYQSPDREPAGPGRTVNRYYFMVQNYNPTDDLVLQHFARSKLYHLKDTTIGPRVGPQQNSGVETRNEVSVEVGIQHSNSSIYTSLEFPFANESSDVYNEYQDLVSRDLDRVNSGAGKRLKLSHPKGPHPMLTCPFAKGDPTTYPRCIFISRRNLSGIKEHLKRNHFGGALPPVIKTSKSWSDLFAYCNPEWQRIYPDPSAETRQILDNLSMGEILSKPTENSGTTSPSAAPLRPQPEDIIFGNSSDQTEYNQKKAPSDPVTIVEGDAPFLDTLNRPQGSSLLFDWPQTQEVLQSSYNDIGSLAREWGSVTLCELEIETASLHNIVDSDPDIDQKVGTPVLVLDEPPKVTEQETRKKRYDISVRRPSKGANSPSIEQPGPKIFTFNDLTEFRSGFEHWMKSEFVDPLFSWDEMLLFNSLEGGPLRSLEEVVTSIKQILFWYRTPEVALYLLMKDDTLSHPQPSATVQHQRAE
ncbi:hypothetical protein AOL_s00210g214 [Orbilia oligospora ATCC 24927]|uniref:C2H2-type domain-containing protein n=1 Tax=Arthrobotrys oligospora (strain ATCC 24927 / CBS 115.81 / DSM 1491) TaxID=756982 RepID=G1XS56_ARTOA|nr:hypothetical protein AOL_s00210g214 [Orbilia oligospora ATCC 24927]EGX44053.1 hypothetical protein AOL_s00210g214 [Orbilia oligospora ATCC 24927]